VRSPFQLSRHCSVSPLTLAEAIFQWIEQEQATAIATANNTQASYINFNPEID
jgi:arginyl-tRNA synthetase